MDEFKQSYGGFIKLMCRIDAVPLPTHSEMRIGGMYILIRNHHIFVQKITIFMPSGRLMDTRQEIISDRVVELHFERSKDFGHLSINI